MRIPFFFALFSLLSFTSFAAEPTREVRIEVDINTRTIPVRVSANVPELDALARQAFGAHGLYRLESRGTYDIRFTQVSGTQVRVDITRNAGTPFASETVAGATARQALLKAADVAVEKTNGLGLRGFFTARLAFIGERTGRKEIFISDLFLGEGRQLTHDNAAALAPRWSPDGSRLLYTSFYKSGFPDIFQIDLKSNARTTFVSFKGLNSGARFSPNGQQVAMILSGEGSQEVYVSNAQGRQIARRTHSAAVKASPCWSPTGDRIVFAMGEPSPQLYVIPSGGGTPSRLGVGYSYVAEPDWSRTNPNKIACTVRVGSQYQIAVYDLSTGKATVSPTPGDGIMPSWLADGRHLVYTARTSRSSTLHILDTETGKTTAISSSVTGPAMEANVWTP
jgi:TolB protein